MKILPMHIFVFPLSMTCGVLIDGTSLNFCQWRDRDGPAGFYGKDIKGQRAESYSPVSLIIIMGLLSSCFVAAAAAARRLLVSLCSLGAVASRQFMAQ